VEPDRLVLITPVGHRVDGVSGAWASEHAIRAFYWLVKWYRLLEVYAPDGDWVEIYVDIGSPPELRDSELTFIDYELDVSRELPHPARIVDEDEFLEAASRYGYSVEFRQTCYEVAGEALELADRGVARGMPRILTFLEG
jgi:protein associated with RNAse G/E